MCVMKLRMQTLVILASLRNNFVMGGHYSTNFVSENDAVEGRTKEMDWTSNKDTQHYVNKNKLLPPFPDDTELAMFGLGCFWGAEKTFWKTKGVYSTQVGYSAGITKNPTYREVCGGKTNHNEVVRVVYKPNVVSYQQLLKVFWESHNPTQGMRQGNDIGTQYRSGIYYYNEQQKAEAEASKKAYEKLLLAKGYGKITTEIREVSEFYYAEDYHQQYLAKNPSGYCGLGGTGVTCPIGLAPKTEL